MIKKDRNKFQNTFRGKIQEKRAPGNRTVNTLAYDNPGYFFPGQYTGTSYPSLGAPTNRNTYKTHH
jgi:hypothetical protein